MSEGATHAAAEMGRNPAWRGAEGAGSQNDVRLSLAPFSEILDHRDAQSPNLRSSTNFTTPRASDNSLGASINRTRFTTCAHTTRPRHYLGSVFKANAATHRVAPRILAIDTQPPSKPPSPFPLRASCIHHTQRSTRFRPLFDRADSGGASVEPFYHNATPRIQPSTTPPTRRKCR